MSATVLAAKIVASWEELSRDSEINRETFLRNLLQDFQHEIVSKTVDSIMGEIQP